MYHFSCTQKKLEQPGAIAFFNDICFQQVFHLSVHFSALFWCYCVSSLFYWCGITSANMMLDYVCAAIILKVFTEYLCVFLE